MAKFYICYREEWKNEIISCFGSVTKCAAQCGISRNNLYKSFRPPGYISENSLIEICKRLDLSPLCFLDTKKSHEYIYNEKNKQPFSEYKKALQAQKINRAAGSSGNDFIIPVLKLCAGLDDDQINALPDSVKVSLSLRISKMINDSLKKYLPGW